MVMIVSAVNVLPGPVSEGPAALGLDVNVRTPALAGCQSALIAPKAGAVQVR